MKNDNLSGLREGLDLSRAFLSNEAENAFLTTKVATDPYPAQAEILGSSQKILVISGGNRCLRIYCKVLMGDGTTKALWEVEVDDVVMAFDFATRSFVPSRVNGVHHNARWMVHRFRHPAGVLECTRSHKVLQVLKSGKPGWIQVGRAVKGQDPVIFRTSSGAPSLGQLFYEGEVGIENTMDITIDHPDHAFVCDGIVVSNSGKSHCFANKLAWDATGLYPENYTGLRTQRGIDAWVLGKTAENTRDACQKKLFGPDVNRPGWTDRPGDEALINAKYILGRPIRKSAPGDAFDTVKVKHVPSDTVSVISFKSHQMDREALASWNGDRALLDEAADAPEDTIGEIFARLMDRKGQMYVTLCPLDGMTPAIKFLWSLPADICKIVYLGHDQAKHLDPAEKAAFKRMFASNPAALLARTEGKITMNSGLIFPFPESDITYDPSRIAPPRHCVFLGGMDVGWRHPTAAVALAWDKMADVAYAYATYNQAERPYVYHHAQLLGWGMNMQFMIDPASDQVSQADGISILKRLWELAHPGRYEENGTTRFRWEDIPEEMRKYVKAERAFPVGMDAMWHRFETRRLLISQHLRELLNQYGAYAWDKDGTGPKEETPTNPYDIITALRYGNLGLAQYARRLDGPAPWQPMEDSSPNLAIKDWIPYRAGRNQD